jgi:leukotriene-A4 hydrolase
LRRPWRQSRWYVFSNPPTPKLRGTGAWWLTWIQQSLGKTYSLLDSKNAELKTAFYQIALRAEDKSVYSSVADLLGEVGRMKFVRPLFRSLNKVNRDLALETFEKNRDFYHPICRQMVEKDLGLVDGKTRQ